MKVSEVMSGDVVVVQQQDSIRAAAELMRSRDIGSVPVSVNDRLVGMVTDRDMVVRALAQGLDADTPCVGGTGQAGGRKGRRPCPCRRAPSRGKHEGGLRARRRRTQRAAGR